MFFFSYVNFIHSLNKYFPQFLHFNCCTTSCSFLYGSLILHNNFFSIPCVSLQCQGKKFHLINLSTRNLKISKSFHVCNSQIFKCSSRDFLSNWFFINIFISLSPYFSLSLYMFTHFSYLSKSQPFEFSYHISQITQNLPALEIIICYFHVLLSTNLH